MRRTMRILHLLNHIRKSGNGIVNVAVDLACLQAQEGHNVAMASGGGDYQPLLESYGGQHFDLQLKGGPAAKLRAIQDFQQIVAEFKPDIIHVHMMTGMLLAWALRGNRSYRLVSTVHNEFQRSAIFMGLADRVIGVSQAVSDAMHRRGVPAGRLRVVRNGTLGSPRTHPIADYEPKPLHRPAITTVAGMYTRKGIRELIEAFAIIAPDFPDVHLYLVGDGPDRSSFEAQAQATRTAQRIHFEKFQAEPQRYLLSTDIFVLYSYREPAGLVLSEAREAGCAIVASRVDGTPEVLEQGQAGVLVPAGNSPALAKALTQLLSNPSQLAHYQQAAQANLQWLSVHRVHAETMAIYADLLPNLEPCLQSAGGQ